MTPQLTQQQLAAIKAYIDSVPALASKPLTSDGAFDIANELKKLASPAFIVWRNKVMTAEVGNAVNYVAVEALTDINRAKVTTFYSMNPVEFVPRIDIRTYWSNTFGGALGGQGQATRDALDALWRRSATVVEKVLATGTGTTVSPATLGAEGEITYAEVEQARSV